MGTATPHNPREPFWPGRLSVLLPLTMFVWFAYRVPQVQSGGQLRIAFDWVPSLDIQLTFMLDGLSLLFILIITGIGCIITIYSDSYMQSGKSMTHFYLYLHAFLLSMLGMVLSDHLMVMFVFWELTTLFSFLLIGFNQESGSARSAARQALLVTGAGGLALLVGILLMKHLTGTYSISRLTWYTDQLQSHRLYLPILLCVLAAAFTKSAQFPFHFWLPNAMNNPTPISALLHSATMVKAGIYLLARLHPTLGGTSIWMTTLVLIGAITAVWGAVVAVAAIIVFKVFWGRKGPPEPYQEAPWQMWLGPMVMGAVGLGFGLIPEWVAGWLVEPAVLAFHATHEDIQLKLFHGFNEPLLLGTLTLTLGAATFISQTRLRRIISKVLEAAPTTMQAAYDGLLTLTTKTARWQTQRLQNGSLANYLTVILGVTLLIVGWAFVSSEALGMVKIELDIPGWLGLPLVSMLTSVGVVMAARVAAHLIGRAAYRPGIQLSSRTWVDELDQDMQKTKGRNH